MALNKNINMFLFLFLIVSSHMDFRLSSHIFLIWLLYNIYCIVKNKRMCEIKDNYNNNKIYILSIAAMFIFPLIAIILHGFPYSEFELWLSQFRGEILGVIIPVLLLLNKIDMKKIILVSAAMVNISAVFGYYSYFVMDSPRLHSFITSNPNVYSTYLLIMLCFCAYGAYYLKQYRMYFGITFINMIVSLFLANSRGCILLFFTALILFCIIQLKNKIIYLLISLSVIISLFAGIVYCNQQFQNRIVNTLSQSRFDNARYVIYSTAVNIIEEHPITGIGMGNFKKVYRDYNEHKDIRDSSYYHVHQIILEMMVESGIFGLIAFIGFIFGQIKVYMKGYLGNKYNTIRKYAALMCLFITGLVFAYMQVENTYFALRKIYWIYVGIGYYLLIVPEQISEKSRILKY